jgi:hypothetical protein
MSIFDDGACYIHTTPTTLSQIHKLIDGKAGICVPASATVPSTLFKLVDPDARTTIAHTY